MSGTATDTSVIVPVLNGERYVVEALMSALDQLESRDEIIVVDNGSSDRSLDIVDKIGDDRIKVFSEATKGPGAARNAGIRRASGAYIAFLDCDDVWPRDRHRRMRAMLDVEPELDGVFGRLRLLFDGPVDPKSAHLDNSLASTVWLHPFLFRRTIIDRVGPMSETLIVGEDSDWLVRAREAGARFKTFDGDAIVYRRHANNMTRDQNVAATGVLSVLAEKLKRSRSVR